MINTNVYAPCVGPSAAYDANFNPTLRGVYVNAPGTLIIKDIYGVAATFKFAAQPAVASGEAAAANVTSFPALIELQIAQIVGNGAGAAGNGTTGTNIALADIVTLA